MGGRFVALDKDTGEEVWAKVMSYGWSTPWYSSLMTDKPYDLL